MSASGAQRVVEEPHAQAALEIARVDPLFVLLLIIQLALRQLQNTRHCETQILS